MYMSDLLGVQHVQQIRARKQLVCIFYYRSGPVCQSNQQAIDPVSMHGGPIDQDALSCLQSERLLVDFRHVSEALVRHQNAFGLTCSP